MIPANLRDSRVVEIEALLASSSISRAHGALQDSLSTTTHMINLMGECRENGVEVEAATTMELANVLWDQGEMMSSIKLLKGLQAESQIEDQDIPVSTASLLTQLVSAHFFDQAFDTNVIRVNILLKLALNNQKKSSSPI